ncbi:uncharacterized protein RCC_05206 [Ramularia collo-cygni]|uniref:Uncharacterized protein n=1 Tax=Ramularia collo-cygni TaxID=112498 RepID=A0A2D3UVP6_9PEZI|nr:uncharacterized protein RCC_05206 [Ramularia collo-cygni]CZT19358.1 uncharacterized protein RCC_05206 [Ramularia collo-cygni]
MGDTERGYNDCPFPDVAELLRPFIKPRQEISKTRQELQTHLPLSALNVALPSERVNASALGGVRKAYWRALQAHNAAQAKYDALKADIAQLNNEPSTFPDAQDSSAFLTECYVPLIRQRERQRKLIALENAFARTKSCGGDAIGESFDKVAKREIGELPGPPSTSAFPEHESESGSDYDLHKLKKAILTTKQQLQQHEGKATSVLGVSPDEIDPRADLRGLQKAHLELTTWMETQLAIISDVEIPKEGDTVGSASPRSIDGGQFSARDIEALYDQYLDARERLLHLVSNPPAQTQTENDEPLGGAQRITEALDLEQQATASEALLPHLSGLLSLKQQEQALLQQSAYTRRQIASAESHSRAILTRLADESHLLQPDINRASPRGTDWAKAATESSAATSKSSMQRLQSGQNSTDAAETVLRAIKNMPESVHALL